MTGSLLAQFTIQGLMTGLLYALMALGITFIYSIMKMINWAMGQFYMIGSFIQYILVVSILGPDLWWLGIPISAATVFLFGLILEPLLIKPMFRRSTRDRDEYATVVTIALYLAITGIATIINGPYKRSPGTTLSDVSLGPLPVSGATLAASIGAVVVMIGFYLILRRTWLGMAFQAVAQNRSAAQTAGLNVFRIDAVAFGIGVALAAIAGALLAPIYMVYPTNGTVVTVKGFEIIVIAGLGSIPGVLLGGILLGIVEALGAGFIDSNYQNVYGFVVLIAILALRPQGLFGEKARIA